MTLKRNTMRLLGACLLVLLSTASGAQMSDNDVDGLDFHWITDTRLKLSWVAVPPVPCLYTITYSVFRGDSKSFAPDESNVVLSGLKTNSASLKHLDGSYYRIRAVLSPVSCAPKAEPGSHETMTIHPLSGDSGGLLMSLRTKWRPVNSKAGALSFLVKGLYQGGGDSAVYYRDSRRCSFSLTLLDSQGFKIREIGINIVGIASAEDSKITGLEANDVASLSIEQYRDFARGGDWNLGWTCPRI